MFKRVRSGLKEFDSSFSVAEKLYQIAQFVIISLGGTGVLGLLAWMDPYFKKIGYLAYGLVFLVCAFIFFCMLFFYKMSKLLTIKERYYANLSEQKTNINPLSDSFSDVVINLEDLRLPLNESHVNKTFRRCKLKGPMAILIVGGVFNRNEFSECGEFIKLPIGKNRVDLAGVLAFGNCTFVDCTFIETTLIVPHDVAVAFQKDVQGLRFLNL
ncbi:hypothetical protein ACJLW5_004924 [Enterobacter hormaechei]|nr:MULTISPECIES: hypothetical protein [Enterobacter cloacae complex]EHF4967112.1 hypothetical protein [Enterobacter hormaechei]ELC6452361.1 hypothetical protein [Enterobacter hormaechei]ELC6466137.1 hypothetical protein [Enterobacter hormaechei]ELD3231244.1 hypothetical protein [Enterobacter hormaechei]ELD3431530.1 hypothetical protein [Enterobacter hormaechei]